MLLASGASLVLQLGCLLRMREVYVNGTYTYIRILVIIVCLGMVVCGISTWHYNYKNVTLNPSYNNIRLLFHGKYDCTHTIYHVSIHVRSYSVGKLSQECVLIAFDIVSVVVL